jgi:hypothetical protein
MFSVQLAVALAVEYIIDWALVSYVIVPVAATLVMVVGSTAPVSVALTR